MASQYKLNREAYRQKKELDELRKVGAIAPEVDEDGFLINPHMPQYMAQKPWYIDDGKSGLGHQRLQKTQDTFAKIGEIIQKGLKKGPVAKRWRKGACENCGAMTHNKKNCLERPRARGAVLTNEDIIADEHIPVLKDKTYDAKRDRWNNYDENTYALVLQRHAKLAEARKKKREEELDKAMLNGDQKARKKLLKMRKKMSKATDSSDSDSDSDSDEESDSDDEMKDAGQVIQSFGAKKRQTVRNLRIRENTAKYLYNLDVNDQEAPTYDPKTRALRGKPDGLVPKEHIQNFILASGDALNSYQQQFSFAAQTQQTGDSKSAVSITADPTRNELAFKKFKSKREEVKTSVRKELLDRYGGQEHLEPAFDPDLLLEQSDLYQEYRPDGEILKAPSKLVPKSRYEEDVMNGNHTTAWGSWFDPKSSQWGYACCRCPHKLGYCTGKYRKTTKTGDRELLPVGKKKKKRYLPIAMRAPEGMDKKFKSTEAGYKQVRVYYKTKQ